MSYDQLLFTVFFQDPFASLDNCFANFDQLGTSSEKPSSAARAETAVVQDVSLWD